MQLKGSASPEDDKDEAAEYELVSRDDIVSRRSSEHAVRG